MNLFARSPYRKWFIIALCVQIITAWYSVGYNQPDEHFQVLEYANYKLGHSPASDLPWEFKKMCRPALQPFIAYCLFKPLDAAGLFNPFIASFLVRTLIGIFTWWMTCRLVLLLLPQFATQKGKWLYVMCSFFLWYVPYIGVRFSTENLAGLLFFLALSLLLQIQETSFKKRVPALAATGLLLGFSFVLRIQIVFAFAGLGIWMFFIKKWPFRDWCIMIPFFLLSIGLSLLIDHWFYGTWVFTPYNYFHANIIQHAAAKYGVYPWWYYIWFLIQTAVPPVSIALLLFFLVGIQKKPLHLFSLVCLTFFLGHDVIGHKEMRFLFPMNFAFIFLVSIGMDTLINKYTIRPVYLWLFRIIAAFNILLLVVRMFIPAQELIKYYAFIYDYTKNKNTTIICLIKSPYYEDSLEENFYKPKNLDLKVIKPVQLSAVLSNAKQPLLFFSHTLIPANDLDGYKTELVYCLFPKLILQNNINQWQERSHIWAIYKVYPKP